MTNLTKTQRIIEKCDLLNNQQVDKLIKKVGDYATLVRDLQDQIEIRDLTIAELERKVADLENSDNLHKKLLQYNENRQLKLELKKFLTQQFELEEIKEQNQDLLFQNSQLQRDLINSQIALNKSLQTSKMVLSTETGQFAKQVVEKQQLVEEFHDMLDSSIADIQRKRQQIMALQEIIDEKDGDLVDSKIKQEYLENEIEKQYQELEALKQQLTSSQLSPEMTESHHYQNLQQQLDDERQQLAKSQMKLKEKIDKTDELQTENDTLFAIITGKEKIIRDLEKKLQETVKRMNMQKLFMEAESSVGPNPCSLSTNNKEQK